MNHSKNTTRMERLQKKQDAGTVANRFPSVKEIIITVTYNEKGIRSILRNLSFAPGSYAFFIINCLNKECLTGGFDMTKVITSMVKSKKTKTKGALCCGGRSPSTAHSDIVYEVAIQYSKS